MEEAYVIDTWGQVDDDPYEVAKTYNLEVEVVDRNIDETTYKFSGKKADIERAKADGYFYSEESELKEGYVKNCNGHTYCSVDGKHWEECSQEEYQEYLDGGYEEVEYDDLDEDINQENAEINAVIQKALRNRTYARKVEPELATWGIKIEYPEGT